MFLLKNTGMCNIAWYYFCFHCLKDIAGLLVGYSLTAALERLSVDS